MSRAATATALALLAVGGAAAIGMGSPAPTSHRVAPIGWAAAGVPGPAAHGAVTSRPTPGPALSPEKAPASSERPAATPVATAATTVAGGPGSSAPTTPDPAQPVVEVPAPIPVPAGRPEAGGGPPAPDSGPSRPTAGGGVPATGTYTYLTSGGRAGPVNPQEYPSRTSMAVGSEGCGVSVAWSPAPGDSDAVAECPVPGGLRVVSETLTMTAQGYSTTAALRCDPDAFIPVGTGQPGQTWSWSCRGPAGEASSEVVTLLGPRAAVVGGVPVSVEDVSLRTTLSGPARGLMVADWWLTSNATPVEERGQTDVSMATFRYHSSYNLQLLSLSPAS